MMGPLLRLVSLSLLIVAAGCSGMKTYPDAGEKNLSVRTKTQSGSIFSNVEAFLHVYHFKDACEVDYLGTVELKNASSEVGLASGRATYLAFAFRTTATGGRSALNRRTFVLTPRPGARYIADVSNVEGIYNASLREVGLRGAPGREIEPRARDCSAAAK
jgi:hypothetical protein